MANDETRPRSGSLVAATVLAAASGGWAAFLWRQLLVARSGGEPFCALGGGCAALWDGGFASGVHLLTGLPVAGWGLVWSLVALALPAWLLLRGGRAEPVWSAMGVTAAAGVASVFVLGSVALSAESVCTNCVVTYALTLAYAGVVGGEALRRRPLRVGPGLGVAAAGTAAGFLLLLYPGLATPRPEHGLGADALAGAPPPVSSTRDYEAEVKRLLERLSPQARQAVSEARTDWLGGNGRVEAAPRALIGPADAPVRLTTFTDTWCGHCATFHEGLERLLEAVPPGSVAIDQRQFPLDQSCNPHVAGTGHPERCLAARVRICAEADPRALELAGALHDRREDLSEQVVLDVAARFVDRERLQACLDAPETQARLEADIRMARDAGIRGTPLVLLNGRPTAPFLPFLYAMAVTGGNATHPLFDDLPPAKGEPLG